MAANLYPQKPGGRGADLKAALVHLGLLVGGNQTTQWERLCLFVSVFPDDGILAEAAPPFLDLINIIKLHATQAIRAQFLDVVSKEDVIHMLQARLTFQQLLDAIKKRNGYAQLNRAELVSQVLLLYKGAPPPPAS